jgi:hypothetical protein
MKEQTKEKIWAFLFILIIVLFGLLINYLFTL